MGVGFIFLFVLQKTSYGPLSIFWRKNKKTWHSGYNQVKFWTKKWRLFKFCVYWLYRICSYKSGTKHLSIIHCPAYPSPFITNWSWTLESFFTKKSQWKGTSDLILNPVNKSEDGENRILVMWFNLLLLQIQLSLVKNN